MKITESQSIQAVHLVGGKGHHLQKLVKWGANVAPFFVITTEAFIEYQESGKIPKEVNERVEGFLKSHPVIVLRSSMLAEDQVDSSFAGLFETILNVTKKNWHESLVTIFNSVKSPRVLEYIAKKKIDVRFEMAVVVQKQIDVEKSGVLFTRSPVPPTSAIAIDAGVGMGEGVVSGHVSVDSYLFMRTGEMIGYVQNNSTKVLNEKECLELIKIALKLESIANAPSDIEWGIVNDQIFIFQIRPITRHFENLSFLVDTNLSESYPGAVSPFSAQFVIKGYENVFNEAVIILGATPERLNRLKFHNKRLISVVDNHLYYNLEHYYAVLRALPGGEKNIENWHKMIGGEFSEVAIPNYKTGLSQLENMLIIGTFIRHITNKKNIYNTLLSDLEKIRDEIITDSENLKSSEASILYIHNLLNRPLGFGLTIINDLYIMVGLRMLSKICKSKQIDESQILNWLKTSQDLDSLKPLHLFNQLVRNLSVEFIEKLQHFKQDPGFDPYLKIFEDLSSLGYQEEVRELRAFLKEFGDRSFEELKLESLPLKNNPKLFFSLLKWSKANHEVKMSPKNESFDLNLNYFQNKILIFTRESIATREATRLWRGKFYHLLRELIINMANQLRNEDPRWQEIELLDFFSLNINEWMDYRNKIISIDTVKERMNKRKQWQTKNQNYPEFLQWAPSESLPVLNMKESVGELSGQGVSHGIVEGVALVLEDPQDAFDSTIEDFILVTKNTDPAWVYIMSRSRALISEKGSLLSHTAIIGRELGLPTIVGVKRATHLIKTGDKIRVNGTSGFVEKLS